MVAAGVLLGSPAAHSPVTLVFISCSIFVCDADSCRTSRDSDSCNSHRHWSSAPPMGISSGFRKTTRPPIFGVFFPDGRSGNRSLCRSAFTHAGLGPTVRQEHEHALGGWCPVAPGTGLHLTRRFAWAQLGRH